MEIDFDNWVKYWKSEFSKSHQNRIDRWQPNHWDVQLRDNESYENKWEYVRNNPVPHGLVRRVQDWPFQGEIYKLGWM